MVPTAGSADCLVSGNVVGYVQLSVPAGGSSLIANPLSNIDNTIGGVLPLPPTATNVAIYTWTGVGWTTSPVSVGNGGQPWSDPSVPLYPGGGVFLTNGSSPLTLTFVGQVLEGNLTSTVPIHSTVVRSSLVPQALPLGQSGQAGTLQFPAADQDQAFLLSGSGFLSYQFSSDLGDWDPADPVIGVAQGFLVRKAAPPNVWTQNFVVSCPSGPGLSIAQTIPKTNSYVTVTWPASSDWLLQDADDPGGPWTSRPGQTSPYKFLPGAPKRFFRLTTNCIAIYCPGNQVLAATGASGATAYFTVTATNLCTGEQVPVVCTPPSGSVFPVGVTTVDCVATQSGLTKKCTFTVTVECQLSANMVGYVQLSVPANGRSLIANPLSNIDNTIGGVLLLPTNKYNVRVYTSYISGVGWANPITNNAGQWTDPSVPLNPGGGVMLTNGDTQSLTLTFVGTVLEGNLMNSIPIGVDVARSSLVPQALPLGQSGQAGTLQFPAADRDDVYLWNGAGYLSYQFSSDDGDWVPAGPFIGVAQGFLVHKAAPPNVWTRNFVVSNPCGPRLAIAQTLMGTNRYVTVTWDAPPEWQLQCADDPEGSWGSMYGQTSPFTFLLPDTNVLKRFFRLANPILSCRYTSTNTFLLSWHTAGHVLQTRPAAVPGWTDVPDAPVLVGDEYQVSLDDQAGWVTETCQNLTNNLFVTTGLGWYWYNYTNTHNIPTNCWVSWTPTNPATLFRLRHQ
jgi:hypothetical protein